MITWPEAILGSPSIDLSEDYRSNVISTQFELSLRQRERYATQDHIKNVSFLFDQFEFDFFKSFVKNTLSSGSQKFLMKLPGLDGLPLTTVSLLGGLFQAQNESYFYWRVNFVLVVENPEVAPADVTSILLGLTGGSPEQILCLFESLYEYIENYWGNSKDLPPCSLLL